MKQFLILLAGMLATSAVASGQTTYTMAQVAQHAKAADCWMVLNSTKVYNFSSFIATHPGGSGMAAYCGKDGTAAFNAIGHSGSAVTLEATYLIGTLAVTPPPQSITVTVVPTSVTLAAGAGQTFTAQITNSTQGVKWSLSNALGALNSSGLTASFVAGPATGTTTITVTSIQDSTKTATATVTIIPVLPPPPPPPPGTMTAAEVAKHNLASDCWMIIGANVYNVTPMITATNTTVFEHPSAGAPLVPYCGRDATGPFTAVGHSNRAVTLLPTFLLGPLVVPAASQLCSITQSTNAFTVTCGKSTPPTPVKTYRCTSTVTATAETIKCTVGGGGGGD